ncbi:dihydrofolate reductase family protein [Micromonospora polyrhachis]|uniref:Dihydrofolate reductase n=1 Tax=Micromonospora polyrhachis TaxID=1282883 RepID=A0A7W7SUX8_9ACTN|nr:dihydrofolate reductase family protein [Micromonospora polyrhachis]MBB4960777.1 dihydrofolate reductase [Micromonospora polyrhachis]
MSSTTTDSHRTGTGTRRIVTGLFISLDGVVEAPETWHFPYLNDEMNAVVGGIMANAGALLLGRATYETFAATWPHQTGEMAEALNAMPKLVASRTMETAEWNNSTILDGDVVAKLTALKQQPGRDIGISGSITLTRALLRAGLVDDLHLLVHPIVLGKGERLFDSGDRIPLTLAASATFRTGVAHLHYQPA